MQLITTQSPMMMTWHVMYQQNDVSLFVNIMIHIIDLMNQTHLLTSWKYCCPLWLIMIQSSMRWWHDMSFGNKVSQIFMAIHEFCDTISFCVFSIYATNNCHGMPYFCVPWGFEVMNSHACVCVLNNLLLFVIMIIILIIFLKKVTHNSLIF